jgi:hypothetical protein
MHPLPLVLRELYVAGRRPSTFRLRMALGGGGMGVTVWAFLVWGTAHGNGRWIYIVLLLLAAFFAIIAGLLMASDSISRERREGTLGFLFLTDLGPADVILGKFVAAALVPGCTLLALFPGLALCQLLGGIHVAEFLRGILALAATLFFSLCATLFVSAHSEDHRKAHAGAALLLIVINPIWLCVLSLNSYYTMVPLLFWLGLPTIIVLGAVLLNSAANTLAVVWYTSAEKSAERKEDQRCIARRPKLNSDPVSWMMSRRRKDDSRLAWILLALLGMFALPVPFGLILLLIVHLVWHLVILTRTSYAFYTDRQDGSLELLLGTELSVSEIFTAFNKSLVDQTRFVLILFSIFDILCALTLGLLGAAALAALPLAMCATLWISALGLGWTGVYRSLLSDHPWVAMINTFLRLSFFPLAISILFLFVPNTNLVQVAVFWVIASGFTALFFGLDASAALQKHGRELLLRPFSEKPPHIENEWSFIDWDEASEASGELQPAAAHT